MLFRIVAFLLLICVFDAGAQGPGEPVEVVLVDGTVLRGELIERSETQVVLEHALLGRIQVATSDLRSLRALDRERPGWRDDPDRNTIMLSPTTQTVGRGQRYFRNFELFILNFGVGASDRLDIVAGALFPISGEANLLAIGAKFMLLDRTKSPIGLAVAGNLSHLEDVDFGSGVAVVGFGSERSSLNFSVHRSFIRDGDPANYVMIGSELQSGPSTKVIAEFSTGLGALFDDDDDVEGFINLGFRWFGEDNSFTLTGIRPVGVDSGSFIAFPLAMYSRHF